ncbi:hypothetical protein SDC9_85850 [bioreactor metagenome]|uniref:DUF1292 domain-containing protein n=1 Tax=bioreactor metagenome TaxID=1076179 RepID=A0A644ZEU1_9ZZZZ
MRREKIRYNGLDLEKGSNEKAVNRMEEERDLVVFSDEEGNEFELEIVDYFDYEDQEYAVLVDPEGCGCGCGDEECHEHDAEVYIMKIVVNGEFEEFLPADEDKMDVLSKIVEERFEAMEDEEDDEEESED